MKRFQWPENKDFAFTVFDDTDLITIDNGPPVYDFLFNNGFLTSKSVWSLQGTKNKPFKTGASCEEPKYLDWCLELKEKGFEICLHNVASRTSDREKTIRGIEYFKQLFGHYPNALANHCKCYEGIYWGPGRLTGFDKLIYNLLTRFRNSNKFFGEDEKSALFWGDVCKERIKYVRILVFGDINTLKACPEMPYHNENTPFVNYWFASSEGAIPNLFLKTISESNQDRLEAEGGACIMYTHFGAGFYKNKHINSRFTTLMKRLSKKNGWFIPVTTLLDYILKERGHISISKSQLYRMELKWIWYKIKTGGTSS